jgi:hypothetical protein
LFFVFFFLVDGLAAVVLVVCGFRVAVFRCWAMAGVAMSNAISATQHIE